MSIDRNPTNTASTVTAETAGGILYVSWGGTGRAATLRQALTRANDSDRGLTYLAILDDSAFGDIERSMLDLAIDELAWLLDAQLELALSQTGSKDIGVAVVVRAGDVAKHVIETVAATGATAVMIGAPIPEEAAQAVAELLSLLNSRLDVPIDLIEP